MSTAPPPRARAGDEPATARSALPLRRVLAVAGLLLWFVVGTAVLVSGGSPWWVALAAALVAVSAVDLLVITRRLRRGDPG